MDIDSDTVTSKLQITQIMWVSVRSGWRLKIIVTLSLVEHGVVIHGWVRIVKLLVHQ